MLTKLRKRYYCEHCKKSGGSAGAMQRHESGCTANRNRVCGMCKIDIDQYEREEPQADIDVLIAAAKADYEAGAHEDACAAPEPTTLRQAAHDCPACMLAAIRLSGVYLEFDFKYEAESFWKDRPRDDGQ